MKKQDEYVSATELAALAKCEHQALFDFHVGHVATRVTEGQRQAGVQEHTRHHRDVLRYAQKPEDRRCFIATAVYGADAEETCRLRRFRDDVLMRYRVGHVLVALYYAVSPYLVNILTTRPALCHIVRAVLDRWVLRWLIP